MEWYYADGGSRLGPVRGGFEALRASGKIPFGNVGLEGGGWRNGNHSTLSSRPSR